MIDITRMMDYHGDIKKKRRLIRRRREGQAMKRQGHYCKVCDEYKANEKFSGKGHAANICKACAQLLPEERLDQI